MIIINNIKPFHLFMASVLFLLLLFCFVFVFWGFFLYFVVVVFLLLLFFCLCVCVLYFLFIYFFFLFIYLLFFFFFLFVIFIYIKAFPPIYCQCSFLAHLSRIFRMSYCDHSPSVVHPSVVRPAVHTFERPPLKPWAKFLHVEPCVKERLKICQDGLQANI